MTDAKKPQSEGATSFAQTGAKLHVSSAALVECWSALGSEVMTFLAERIRDDFETQRQMLQCRSLPELAQVRATFFQRAIDQYTAETGRMVDIGTKALDEMVHLKLS